MGTREIVQTLVKLHQFQFLPVLSSVSYEVQQLFLTFGVAKNDFFLRNRSLQYHVQCILYNLGTRFLYTCYSNF